MSTPAEQASRGREERSESSVRAALGRARRIVVKVGSRSLVAADNRIDEAQLGRLVAQLAALRGAGGLRRDAILVTSGAVASGMPALGFAAKPRDMPSRQAAAAVGQAALMERYRALGAGHGVTVGQILLTAADLRSRDRHLNVRHTFSRLLELGVLPIVNENDSVAVAEIRVGDNDQLSAMVATLVRADALVLLTTAPGLLDRPPEQGGALVPFVDRVTAGVRAMACGTAVPAGVSTGGMHTKVLAASMAVRAGAVVAIADAREADVLARLVAGEAIGTIFAPSPTALRGRKRWIAFFERPRGALVVDDGAARAIGRGGSLLPVGVVRVDGTFGAGDPVRIVDQRDVELGRGLANYAAADLRRIAGLRSERIEQVLGHCEFDDAVHRDNLVVDEAALPGVRG